MTTKPKPRFTLRDLEKVEIQSATLDGAPAAADAPEVAGDPAVDRGEDGIPAPRDASTPAAPEHSARPVIRDTAARLAVDVAALSALPEGVSAEVAALFAPPPPAPEPSPEPEVAATPAVAPTTAEAPPEPKRPPFVVALVVAVVAAGAAAAVVATRPAPIDPREFPPTPMGSSLPDAPPLELAFVALPEPIVVTPAPPPPTPRGPRRAPAPRVNPGDLF